MNKEDSEFAVRTTLAEWGDETCFFEWYDGEQIRHVMIETMWTSAMNQMISCLTMSATIGELENVSRVMVGEIFKITDCLEIDNENKLLGLQAFGGGRDT